MKLPEEIICIDCSARIGLQWKEFNEDEKRLHFVCKTCWAGGWITKEGWIIIYQKNGTNKILRKKIERQYWRVDKKMKARISKTSENKLEYYLISFEDGSEFRVKKTEREGDVDYDINKIPTEEENIKIIAMIENQNKGNENNDNQHK